MGQPSPELWLERMETRSRSEIVAARRSVTRFAMWKQCSLVMLPIAQARIRRITAGPGPTIRITATIRATQIGATPAIRAVRVMETAATVLITERYNKPGKAGPAEGA